MIKSFFVITDLSASNIIEFLINLFQLETQILVYPITFAKSTLRVSSSSLKLRATFSPNS